MIKEQLKDIGKSYYRSIFVRRAMLLLSISILEFIYIRLIFPYRDSLFSIVKQLDLVGLEHRTRDLN